MKSELYIESLKMWGTWILISCILMSVQSTPDNSNLQGKPNTVRVIGSRLYLCSVGTCDNPLKQATWLLSILSTALLSIYRRFLINLLRRTFPTTHEERSRTAPAQQDKNLVLLSLLLVVFCSIVACIVALIFRSCLSDPNSLLSHLGARPQWKILVT